VLIRHNPQTGQVQQEVDWEHGGLRHVAVDDFGTVWTISDHATKPKLRVYDASNTIQWTHDLEPGIIEDLIVDAEKNAFVLVRAKGQNSFKISKQSPQGVEVWKDLIRFEGGDARGLALLPGGTMVVAGQTSQSQGLLVWFDQVSGELIHEVVVDSATEFERFVDVAVAPTGDYGVAVGIRGEDIDHTSAWIYRFET
jgi:hypothetical protein